MGKQYSGAVAWGPAPRARPPGQPWARAPGPGHGPGPGLRVACRSEGVLPDTLTQVYVANSCDSLYACYRLSPVAFLGQSMDQGAKGIDPFVPAAFGCALLYGPNVSFYEERYSRLVKEGGARMIRSAATLAQAISHLSNPTQSAKMALAAWETISEGAELTDALIDIALAHCDAIEPQE